MSEKFVDIYDLPHTVKLMGVYTIMINDDLDGFDSRTSNYFHDIGIYEQLILKHQESEMAINEVSGITTDINLLDFDQLAEVVPLVDAFEDDFILEITAMDELIVEIGLIVIVDTDLDEDDETDEE